MKKERTKGFISGILVSALVFSLVGTAAATIGKRTLTADYNDIKIELNGKRITPTDANGNAVEPFAVNGTTYLPVRAVGNALGMNVSWDGKTSTVKLAGDASASGPFDECYPGFSVPTLDNVVGLNAYVDSYLLESGDSIVYYYDPAKFNVPENFDVMGAYGAMLEDYAFKYRKTTDGREYFNSISGTTILLYTDKSTKNFCVLIMALPESSLDAATVEYAWVITTYSLYLRSLCYSAALYLENGSGSAAEIKEIKDEYYNEILSQLETLRNGVTNEQMSKLYVLAGEQTVATEEVIYRFALHEASPSTSIKAEFYSMFDIEQIAHRKLMDAVGDFLIK